MDESGEGGKKRRGGMSEGSDYLLVTATKKSF